MKISEVFSALILVFPLLLMTVLALFIVIRGIRRDKIEESSIMNAHPKNEIIEPTFDVALEGFAYIGRGPNPYNNMSGWIAGEEIFYRCVKCGNVVKSTVGRYENYICACGAMQMDCDWGRTGSKYGDNNILVYEKK
jgi:hypothetical protein